ncbi:MAG: peptidylprolyl isomerase [Deltaproteobacteria bacterium]|nr:peptidylprolyl isomerase [Deltaproteobacteria bacterium]
MSINHCILVLVLAVTAPARAASREVVDKIAAVIEGEIITIAELDAKAQPYMAKLDDVKDPKERERQRLDILRRVLDIEIGERIVDAELERSRDKLGVADADVDRAVQEVQKLNNLNEQQLQQALYAQGITWAEYRKKLKAQIERTRLIQFQVQGKVQVKDADVEHRCEERQQAQSRDLQLCAAHLLTAIPKGAAADEVEQIHARASKLQAELQAGADFSAYALKYSDDKGAPDGNLGCFGKGEMVEPFEKAAFALKVGEVSPVVRTEFGFHIIKLNDRRAPGGSNCKDETVLNTFRNEIYQEELDRQMNNWLTDLRRKRFVEVRF